MFESHWSKSGILALGIATLSTTSLGATEPEIPTTSSDRVTSQVLFERGKALFIEGRYREACPLFEESQKLAPGIGVLLHLGACLEKSGKTASAWAAFQEAADRARAENDAERESMARARAESLRDRRAFVTLKIRPPDSEAPISAQNAPAGMQVNYDAQALPTATLGLELPVDPGTHSIRVLVPDMLELQRTIELTEGEHVALELQLLPNPRLPATETPRALTPQPPTTTVTLSYRPRAPEPGSPRTWVTWSALGLGTAGLLVGTTAGLIAYGKMQDARDLCAGHAKNACPDASLRLQDRARLPANVATVGFAAGLASIAFAGGYWFLSRPRQTVVTGALAPGFGHVALATRW